MAWQEKEYKLKSQSPLLMRNGQMADPRNQFAKSLKQISSKRIKTDADYEEIARIEFYSGLYMDKDGPIVPADNLTAMIINAAKKLREGPAARSGMFVLEHSQLEYEGPRDADSLWADESFRHVAMITVNHGSHVPRTRPVFHSWEVDVKVSYDDEQVSEGQLDEWLRIAGSQIGLGDWRPRYGRFDVIETAL